MKYIRVLAACKRALVECRAAREDLHIAVDSVIGVYHAHPVPALAGAAGIGFVIAQLRVGSGLMRAGMRIASGPVWRLVRGYFHDRP